MIRPHVAAETADDRPRGRSSPFSRQVLRDRADRPVSGLATARGADAVVLPLLLLALGRIRAVLLRRRDGGAHEADLEGNDEGEADLRHDGLRLTRRLRLRLNEGLELSAASGRVTARCPQSSAPLRSRR